MNLGEPTAQSLMEGQELRACLLACICWLVMRSCQTLAYIHVNMHDSSSWVPVEGTLPGSWLMAHVTGSSPGPLHSTGQLYQRTTPNSWHAPLVGAQGVL